MIISAADAAIGQIPQNHYQFADIVIRYGTAQQKKLLLSEVLRGARFGNAVSERTGGQTAGPADHVAAHTGGLPAQRPRWTGIGATPGLWPCTTR
jgi:alkylation response protein AidB-like acyl-CoA dehydrogenase